MEREVGVGPGELVTTWAEDSAGPEDSVGVVLEGGEGLSSRVIVGLM